MPNRNYLAGRRLEYEVVGMVKAAQGLATRSAGSHGPWDVSAQVLTANLGGVWVGFEYAGQSDSGEVVYARTGKHYEDILFVQGFDAGSMTALFIQCKRKKVK